MKKSDIIAATKSLPLLIPFLGFIFTIIFIQTDGMEKIIPLVGLLIALVIIGMIFGWRRSCIFIVSIGLGFGAVLMNYDDGEQSLRVLLDDGSVKSDEPTEIIGWASDVPDLLPDGFRLIVDVGGLRTPRFCSISKGRLSVRVRGERDSRIESGSGVRMTCFPRREEMFRNPGGFGYVDFLDGEGIDATCNLKSTLLLETSQEKYSSTPSTLREIRNHLISQMISMMGPVHGGIVSAVTLGNKEFLDGRVAELFRRGGTFHLLIISGLHMTFIAGLVLFLIALFTDSRWIHFVFVTPIIWAYAEMVGMERPVMRACMMFTLILLGRCLFRASEPLNIVMATAFVTLAIEPSDIFNASFQLTFLSVVAVTSFAIPVVTGLRRMGGWMPDKTSPFPPLPGFVRSFAETIYWNPREWESRSRGNNWSASLTKYPFADLHRFPLFARIISRLFEGLVVTSMVQVVLLPTQIILFHRVSLVGILLNLFTGPLVAIQAVTALLMIVVGNISLNAANAFMAVSVAVGEFTLWTSKTVLDMGIGELRVPVYDGVGRFIYVLHFILLVMILFMLRGWNPLSAEPKRSPLSTFLSVALATTSILSLFTPFSSSAADGRMRIHFLDVGQGDSAFVVFPGGETMLIDGGGIPSFLERESVESFIPDSMRVGESVVSEFLWEMGYSSIDHVVATHSDADHLQGLVDVTSNFEVGTIHLGQMNPDSNEYRNLITSAATRGVKVGRAFAGDRMDVGGVRIEVLNPPRDRRVKNSNEGSLVLRFVHGKRRFLLTGDIESEGEAFLVSHRDIRADVVKVAHHGSRTSSSQEFIQAVNANHAIISAGRRSRFGHPHEEVVDRWKSSGAKVMTTGVNGTITIMSDGNEIAISTFVQR